MKQQSNVCIVYPADPLGVIPGGIDTFIRGILRWAPSDITIHLVGVTTDRNSRPVRRWTTCRLEGQPFRFYPILDLENPEKQAAIPVVLRFMFGLMRDRPTLDADVLEFHRIEPILPFVRDGRPKSLVMHQNMNDLRNAGSDIRWRHCPPLYFKLEDFALPRFSSIFCVREDAASRYRQKFPTLRERIHFTPTWVDTEIFHPPNEEERSRNREWLNAELGFENDDFVLITVGRLDKQKDPLLLLEAFSRVNEALPDTRLMFVGDGVLRGQLADSIRRIGLEDKVKLCGLQPPERIARYLQAADAFVLSSAYEGMPMCILEALGSGLPVVSTDVGEVSRVVEPKKNGELVQTHDAESLAHAIVACRDNIEHYRGEPCWRAVQEYTPQRVLMPIFENYRRLAAKRIGEQNTMIAP